MDFIKKLTIAAALCMSGSFVIAQEMISRNNVTLKSDLMTQRLFGPWDVLVGMQPRLPASRLYTK